MSYTTFDYNSAQYGAFIEQETSARLDSKYSYCELVAKLLLQYLCLGDLDECEVITKHLDELGERELDNNTLISLYNKVNYIGKAYTAKHGELTFDNLFEIGEILIIAFKTTDLKISDDMGACFRELQSALKLKEIVSCNTRIFLLERIINMQKHIGNDDIKISMQIEKCNVSSATYLDVLRSYYYQKHYIAELGSLSSYHELMLSNFTTLFDLLNTDISSQKGLEFLKNIDISDYDLKQVSGEVYFSIYSKETMIDAIRSDISCEIDRTIAVVELGVDNECSDDLYWFKDDVTELRTAFLYNKELIIDSIKQLQAINYFYQSIGDWLNIDMLAISSNMESINKRVGVVNDTVLTIDHLCKTSWDQNRYFNLFPLITEAEYTLEIQDDLAVKSWLTDIRNYNAKTVTEPLRKILGVDNLKGVVSDDNK